MIKELKCGLKYKVVKLDDFTDYDIFFMDHLRHAFESGDRLSKNYTIKSIDRMIEYGYVYKDTQDNLAFMVGIEKINDRILRSETRLFVHENFRSNYWKSIDNYETVIYQINNHIEKCDFIFKSREAKNTAGFRIAKRLNIFFEDWQIYPNVIELLYKNNFQWICYKNIKGDLNEHVQKICYTI